MCSTQEDTIFLDSPFVYSLLLHIMTALSTPVHILGLYIILFRTPKSMGSVKWYLFNLQIWIVLFDISVGFFTIPVLLLPRFAMFPMGILKVLGVPSFIQTFSVFALLGFMMISIIAIFKNRFFAVCSFRWKKFCVKWKRTWIMLHYFGVIVALIIFGFMSPNQEMAKQRLLEALPCLPAYIRTSPIFIACEDYTYQLLLMVFFTTLACLEVLFFAISIGWHSIQQLRTKQISSKTFKMQRNFFFAVLIQIGVPMVLLLFPFGYQWMAVVCNYYNQAYNNLSMITEAMHGLVSTIVTLLVHRPYNWEDNWVGKNHVFVKNGYRYVCEYSRMVNC
ncbi:hypothetical protein L5515_006530 [Caenorhabditis briggsae]|uniref:Serpentine Receptor, class H n=1 Tax=Caenorhabditis briggsae TaxID=6238 RepID=A0AAE9F2K2_CAEBR|nr:hypothetical protein L5515_006530 [Caenorhabditis briggsae]